MQNLKDIVNRIHTNRSQIHIGANKGISMNFYNIDGIVWEWFHEGTGTFPNTTFMKLEDFLKTGQIFHFSPIF